MHLGDADVFGYLLLGEVLAEAQIQDLPLTRRQLYNGGALDRASRPIRRAGVPRCARRALLRVSLGKRQWAGLTITAVGLAIIGLTGGAQGAQRSSLAALSAVEGAFFALAAVLVRISARRDVENRHEGLLLATVAGVLFGVSDVAIKYLSHAHGPAFGLISPWTLAALISFAVSFFASARSLQIGQAVEVIVIMSVAANLSAIIGGILVFGETIGTGGLGITARVLAFCLVIAGAALVPAPQRANATAPSPANTTS